MSKKTTRVRAASRQAGTSQVTASLLPLGAIAAGFGLALNPAMAQTAPAPAAAASAPASSGVATLPQIKVKAAVEPTGKESLRATTTSIGKGKQELRDIPQAVTVVTERLIDDRNLDDFKDVLRSTAGITFQAGETGEEDIRLRGFSLGQTGDIYVDGIRDASLYERDTFNNERVEVLKGSASMLFGRGSTGGVVNQVNKQPFLMNQHEVTGTLGSGNERRLTGDFNLTTGQDAALRINAMVHEADNWGAKVSKKGIAPSFSWGIGTADEFTASLYHLEFDNVPSYNHPWFVVDGKLNTTLPAKNFYGLDSDYNKGSATYATLAHTHRFAGGGELTTRVRHGRYERELWASVIRFGQTNGVPTTIDNLGPGTIVTRSPKGRIGKTESTFIQSDYSNSFDWLGKRHTLLTGIDIANEDADRNNNFAGAASGLDTTVGTPNNGDSRDDPRGAAPMNTFNARSIGLYVQDTLELTPAVKLIAGLRYDRFKARYDTVASVSGNGTVNPAMSYSRTDSLWSPRLGALYQPNDWASYHVSYGTSFNTSGDTYQFANQNTANTPPEKSRNIEVGAKFDLFERRLSLGTALFYAQKYNERNTDPDTAATQMLLSGKRHAAGVELDIAGRITPDWEAFLSYTWIPTAKIDKSTQALAASGGGAQIEGDRPGLTPKHSASLWTTYRVTPKLRLGGGLNYRGEQNPEGNRAVTADSFVTADLMAEYVFNDKLSLKFNVNNVTDELYADTLYRGFYGPGAPRTAQLTLKAKF